MSDPDLSEIAYSRDDLVKDVTSGGFVEPPHDFDSFEEVGRRASHERRSNGKSWCFWRRCETRGTDRRWERDRVDQGRGSRDLELPRRWCHGWRGRKDAVLFRNVLPAFTVKFHDLRGSEGTISFVVSTSEGVVGPSYRTGGRGTYEVVVRTASDQLDETDTTGVREPLEHVRLGGDDDGAVLRAVEFPRVWFPMQGLDESSRADARFRHDLRGEDGLVAVPPHFVDCSASTDSDFLQDAITRGKVDVERVERRSDGETHRRDSQGRRGSVTSVVGRLTKRKGVFTSHNLDASRQETSDDGDRGKGSVELRGACGRKKVVKVGGR